MLPDFLEKYKAQIEKYKLECIKILAHPLKDGQTLSIKQSKFLGKPYIPKGKPYPMGYDGTPMILLSQINFSEIPKLENYPDNGILQLFVHPSDWYDMDENSYKIMFHDSDSEDYITDFSFLTEDLYEDSPVYCEHALTFKKEIELGGIEDFRFDIDFDGLDYFNFQETLPKEQQELMDNLFEGIGHKIGGYAYFTQGDPREYNDQSKDDMLLLQIDTDEEIMFGDSGVANVFININDLKEKRFEKAYFNWDCC